MPRIPIFNMFGPSPIRPLEVHMDKAHACVKKLVAFFKAVSEGAWEKAEKYYQKISHLEKEADDLKKDLRLNLPKDLLLPVSRGDLLMMLTMQDRIANKAKDIAGLVVGRKMSLPDTIVDNYMVFLNRCIDASAKAHKAINELDELLEAGFRGKEASLVGSMIHELDKIEHDTDELQVQLRRKVFAIENQLPPVDVIFLYKIIEWTGDLADRAQEVGGQLQLLLAR